MIKICRQSKARLISTWKTGFTAVFHHRTQLFVCAKRQLKIDIIFLVFIAAFFSETPFRLPRAIPAKECKPTPWTPICSTVVSTGPRPREYFNTTFQSGNYFNHGSTDEAVYELSKYLNLLSSLYEEDSECFDSLIPLLCHLHLPVCHRGKISQTACSDVMRNNSSCFIVIKDLNTKGANFTWPPVNVDCQNTKWFTNATVLPCK